MRLSFGLLLDMPEYEGLKTQAKVRWNSPRSLRLLEMKQGRAQRVDPDCFFFAAACL